MLSVVAVAVVVVQKIVFFRMFALCHLPALTCLLLRTYLCNKNGIQFLANTKNPFNCKTAMFSLQRRRRPAQKKMVVVSTTFTHSNDDQSPSGICVCVFVVYLASLAWKLNGTDVGVYSVVVCRSDLIDTLHSLPSSLTLGICMKPVEAQLSKKKKKAFYKYTRVPVRALRPYTHIHERARARYCCTQVAGYRSNTMTSPVSRSRSIGAAENNFISIVVCAAAINCCVAIRRWRDTKRISCVHTMCRH